MVTDRPEWASGPEWEGWLAVNRATCIYRNAVGIDEISIANNDYGVHLTLIVGDDEIEVKCLSVAHALTAANALAEAAGGWS